MIELRESLLRPVWAAVAGVGDLLLPQTCLVCGRPIAGSASMCGECFDELDLAAQAPYCPRCGRTMRPEAIHGRRCARCTHEPFWNLAQVVRIAAYEPVLRSLVRDVKYAGRVRCADYLAQLLAQRMRRLPWTAGLEALVPVPMTWLRRVQRPCDHADLLARTLGQQLGIPVRRVVRRRRHAPSQTLLLTRHARFANVRACFAATRGAASLAGKRVCIVDNLLASGATAYEVARELHRAGVRRVYLAVLARWTLPGDSQAHTSAAAAAIS